MKKVKVYLASSFAYRNEKTKKERIKNIEAAQSILEQKFGFDVYVPHHHKVHRAWDYTEIEWAEKVAENDYAAIRESDIVILLTYGKEKNNAGVSCECGYAYGIRKPILLVKMNDEEESMMMYRAAFGNYVEGLSGLENISREYLDDIITWYENPHAETVLSEPDPDGEKQVIPFHLS